MFLREIVWHGPNVQVIEPIDLREAIISLLDGVLK